MEQTGSRKGGSIGIPLVDGEERKLGDTLGFLTWDFLVTHSD